jgi:hypothetical protein
MLLLLLPAAVLGPSFSSLDLNKLHNNSRSPPYGTRIRNKSSTTNHPLAEYLKNDYFLTHGTQCCGSGSGIWDGRKSVSGSGIRDEQPGSCFLELRNHFFAFLGVKILKFFDEDPGSGMETVRIRDGKKSDPG